MNEPIKLDSWPSKDNNYRVFVSKTTFTHRKITEAHTMILDSLCKHYGDENCQRCEVSCPYYELFNKLHQLRDTLNKEV